MGSGKSTVAKLLSRETGILWYDLDTLIEVKTQLTIPAIFDSKGELFFRKTEHEVLSDVMQSSDSFILSLGGGTPCYSNNLELLNRPEVSTFLLSASIETLLVRLKKQVNTRPLLMEMNDDSAREFIAKHLFERNTFYNQAQYKVDTDNKTPEQIVKEIRNILV